MMSQVSIKKNTIYNIILQVFNVSFPLITSAYISRVVGVNKIGNISYVQSAVALIMVFSNIGLASYGIKEIARHRDDKVKTSNIFSELIILRGIISVFLFLIYLIGIRYFLKFEGNEYLFYVTGLLIILNVFEVDWFFAGIEDYKIITLRNIILKLATFVLIFYFVKDEKDYLKYASLLVLNQGVTFVYSFFYARRKVIFHFKGVDLKRHIQGLKHFLFYSICIGIYSTSTILILGIYGSDSEVAFFTRARQFQFIGLALTGALITAISPRVIYLFHNDRENFYRLLKKSLDYIYILSLPLLVVMMAFTNEINLIVGGVGFLPASNLLLLLAPLILIINIGTTLNTQICIPFGMEKMMSQIKLVMVFSSILLSFTLIKKYAALGASIAVGLTELIGLLCTMYVINKNKDINFSLFDNTFYKSLVSSLLMGSSILLFRIWFEGIGYLLLGSFMGGIFYFILLFLLREKNILDLIKEYKTKVF